MKRVGLLAGLLVLTLGAGAVAESPSPEATSLYAPESLAFVLPEPPGAVDWEVTGGGSDVMADSWGIDVVYGLTQALDKKADDVRFAAGSIVDQPMDDILNLDLFALRIVNTPAEVLLEPLLTIMSGTPLDQWDEWPGLSVEWRDVDDRNVLVLLDDAHPDRWTFWYPYGEVLFGGFKSGVVPLTIEEVLAGLSGEGGSSDAAAEPTGPDDLTRAGIIHTFAVEGFTGDDMPLGDGTPRWFGRGPDGAMLDIVGQPDQVTSFSLTVPGGAEGEALLRRFVDLWAPGSFDFASSLVQDAAATGIAKGDDLIVGDRLVLVQAYGTEGDGAVMVTIIPLAR